MYSLTIDEMETNSLYHSARVKPFKDRLAEQGQKQIEDFHEEVLEAQLTAKLKVLQQDLYAQNFYR